MKTFSLFLTVFAVIWAVLLALMAFALSLSYIEGVIEWLRIRVSTYPGISLLTFSLMMAVPITLFIKVFRPTK
jgi:hypothetical protein